MQNKKIIIIGAGPAGLTAGYEILNREPNAEVIIFEDSDAIGGIARTVDINGNKIDIGIHRFFSKSDRVLAIWNSLLPRQNENFKPEDNEKIMLVRDRLTRIFYLKKLFNYPISLNKEFIFNLGFLRCAKIGFSYIKSVLFPYKNVDSLEKFYINRFGRELYNLFFRDYTEKVWGVKPSELSPEWGAQRVKGLSIYKTIINSLKPKKKNDIKQKGVETSLIETFLYPKYGSGQLWEALAKDIESKGGKIYLNSKITKLNIENDKVVSVAIEDKINKKEIIEKADYFISTMPIKDLITSFSQVPNEIYNLANNLQYRDFIIVGILLKDISLHSENGIIKDNWIYIQEPYVKIARIGIINNWSPYMVKDENCIYVGVEYMCFENDELWSMKEDDFINFTIDEMKKLKLIKDEDVISSNIIKMKKAYPSYTGVYNEFHKIREYTDKIENLFLAGRNGMHRYNNMDHSMICGIEAANCILSDNKDKSVIWEVNTEEEYHEVKSEK